LQNFAHGLRPLLFI